MCQPAAPHEMKPRSMLCHSVKRVPPPRASSSHRVSPYSSTSGSSPSITLATDKPIAPGTYELNRLPCCHTLYKDALLHYRLHAPEVRAAGPTARAADIRRSGRREGAHPAGPIATNATTTAVSSRH